MSLILSYHVLKRSCVNGFIGTRSRWAQIIVCLFNIDVYLSCLLAKKKKKKKKCVSVCAVLSLLPMASSVLPVGNHPVFRMFIPGHSRLIHPLFEPQNEKTYLHGLPPCTIQTALLSYTGGKTWNFTYRNFKYCDIQAVNTTGADQTARICRQVYTLKFVFCK